MAMIGKVRRMSVAESSVEKNPVMVEAGKKAALLIRPRLTWIKFHRSAGRSQVPFKNIEAGSNNQGHIYEMPLLYRDSWSSCTLLLK